MFFFFQAEDGIRDWSVTGVQTCALPILVDIDSRAVHYWSEDQSTYKLYPSSVPLTDDLTRRGRTKVVLKDPEPDWRPTPSMKKRNPEWQIGRASCRERV